MAAKRAGRRAGRAANGHDGESSGLDVVKVTLRLSGDTARRLGVESVMSGEPQSSIAERVLAAHLKRWRLPSTIEPAPAPASASADSAA